MASINADWIAVGGGTVGGGWQDEARYLEKCVEKRLAWLWRGPNDGRGRELLRAARLLALVGGVHLSLQLGHHTLQHLHLVNHHLVLQ